MKKILALLLLVAMVVMGCSSDSGQKKDAPKAGAKETKRVVRLAIQPSAAFVPLVIAREKGWIDEAMKGMGVEVKWTDFESGPPMNESFAAGQQDIGVIGDVPSVAAVAAGQKNVFIATADGGPSYAMLVADDSGIKSVADLKGKKIGLTIGSTAQNLAGKLLAKAGLDIKKDVEIINISTGDAQTVLLNHNVDAVVIWEPNVSRLDATDKIHILTHGGDIGFPGVNVVFARQEFVKQNPDIVKVYLQQYWRATKAYEKNPKEYAELLSKYFKLDPGLVAKAASKYAYVLKFDKTEVDGLQDTVSFLIQTGSIKKEIQVKDYVDDAIAKSVVSEAK
jgi:sulfonate transport system substrate-binding protein